MIQLDIDQLSRKLDQLRNNGVFSSPLKAIMCAAEVSAENSPIFVFSDGSESITDQELLGELEAIVAEKNLEINIITGNLQISKRSVINRPRQFHYKRQINNIDIYQELAFFSDGQIIQIPVDEISDIGPVVTYSATQSSNTIFRHSNTTFGSTHFSFLVNSYTDQILICINGQYIEVSAYTPQGKLPFDIYSNCLVM